MSDNPYFDYLRSAYRRQFEMWLVEVTERRIPVAVWQFYVRRLDREAERLMEQCTP